VSGGDGDGFGASRALEARADTTRLATVTIASASTGTISMAMKYRTDWPMVSTGTWQRTEGSMAPPQHGQMSSRRLVS